MDPPSALRTPTKVVQAWSELLTHVISHLGEGTPVSLCLAHRNGCTRLEVTDPDPHSWLFLLRQAAGDEENGRGLALLDSVALRWGVERSPDGKTVWCELPGGAQDADGRPRTS